MCVHCVHHDPQGMPAFNSLVCCHCGARFHRQPPMSVEAPWKRAHGVFLPRLALMPPRAKAQERKGG